VSASLSSNGMASPESDWVAAYEALRRAALEEADGFRRRTAGATVLLRAGLVAWMQTCRSVASAVPVIPPSEPVAPLPTIVRTDVAVLLAEMALSAATEMATC
jgi:hypothetical protein